LDDPHITSLTTAQRIGVRVYMINAEVLTSAKIFVEELIDVRKY